MWRWCWRRPVGLVAVLVAAAACRQALSTVVDLPPPPRTPAPAAAVAPPQEMVVVPPKDTVRPPIERLLDADSVIPLLPRDHAGNIDWMAALAQGVIKPRSTLPGVAEAGGAPAFQFAFDFNFPGPDTTYDARFAHSSHTEWVDCRQCHDRIFPYRNMSIKMVDVFQGKFCGECHGKVAFPVLTGCERCHVRAVMPPDRAKPELIGTLKLTRPSKPEGGQTLSLAELPAATFPHWVHRIRYRCKTCHMALFEPRNGANAITMADISAGRACGRCHDGVHAFKAGFGACERCHIPLSRPPSAPVAASGS